MLYMMNMMYYDENEVIVWYFRVLTCWFGGFRNLDLEFQRVVFLVFEYIHLLCEEVVSWKLYFVFSGGWL